jgi:hypothetical protein
MEDVRQIAVAGYKQVLEDGRDVRDSESDSEHSDDRDDIPIASMYTTELICEDGKPTHRVPPKLSSTQATVLRAAAHAQKEVAGSTIQAEPQPLA